MKNPVYPFFATLLLLTSCTQSSPQSWEDLKTAGRYMQKGVDALWGKDYESRMLTSDDEFVGPYDEDFIPLRDADLRNQLASDTPLPQPNIFPGMQGIPSLDNFYAPSGELRSLFHSVHFDTDAHVLHQKDDVQTIFRIAAYLKEHPTTYLVVLGHCDERASASYNMALGIRRANYVRSLLVKHGVDLNRVYTVSRGKEEPVVLGHSGEEWKQNRRAEFKIYQKK